MVLNILRAMYASVFKMPYEPAATKNPTPKVEEAFEASDDEESSEGEESTPE